MTIQPIPTLAVALFTLLGSPSESAASDCDGQPAVVRQAELLPTVVVGPPKSTEYPEPICSKCQVVIERSTSADGEDAAMLLLTYDDDQFPSLLGDIELTLLMFDDARKTLHLFDVSLACGEDLVVQLAADVGWSWTEVAYVWIRVQPST